MSELIRPAIGQKNGWSTAGACALFVMVPVGCAVKPSPPRNSNVASPSSIVRTPIRVDDAHPPNIGEEFYPAQSRKLGEEGKCLVKIRVDEDGVVRVAELQDSSGFERLDAACIQGIAAGRYLPATENGKAVSSWAVVPIIWKLYQPSAMPHIREDYALKVGPKFYPNISRRLHQEGDCVVHLYVSETGKTSDFTVSKSTGYAPLDEACLAAVKDAQFIPELKVGVAIASWTDISLSWRLPELQPP